MYFCRYLQYEGVYLMEKMEQTMLWTWDARMSWSWPGMQTVIVDEDAYLKNYTTLIDYAAETGIKAIVIWGFLRSTHGGIGASYKVTEYASKKGIRIMPGVGVRSYGGFAYESGRHEIKDECAKWSIDQLLLKYPEFRAVDEEGQVNWWSHINADIFANDHGDACPSKTKELLGWYLEGIEWMYKTFEIGGMWLEMGDNLTICQCRDCLERRGSQSDRGFSVLSYEDEALWMPPLTRKALDMRPDSWMSYTHNLVYNKETCNNPSAGLVKLLESIPKDATTVWTISDIGMDADKVLEDCDECEAYRLMLKPPEPRTKFNITYWGLGGHWLLYGLDGCQQYTQMAKIIKKGRAMGHTGICIYGETGDSCNSMTGRVQMNEINYLAMVDFCNEPDLTVEEFEARHKDKIKHRIGSPERKVGRYVI